MKLTLSWAKQKQIKKQVTKHDLPYSFFQEKAWEERLQSPNVHCPKKEESKHDKEG